MRLLAKGSSWRKKSARHQNGVVWWIFFLAGVERAILGVRVNDAEGYTYKTRLHLRWGRARRGNISGELRLIETLDELQWHYSVVVLITPP